MKISFPTSRRFFSPDGNSPACGGGQSRPKADGLRIGDSGPHPRLAAGSTHSAKARRNRWGAWVSCTAVLAGGIGAAPGLDAQAVPAQTRSILTASGNGTYQLTCTVTGPAISGVAGLTGTVSFSDVTAGKTLGTTALSSVVSGNAFAPPQVFPAGDLPVSIASGDFNGDGKLDVVFGNADGSISLLLGNGDGTFQAPAMISTTATLSFSMATGDFNSDGKLDVAVADWDSNNVYILLGNGDGTFQASRTSVNSARSYGSMISADVNGDGKPDLVMTDFNTSEVSVLLGIGDGTFQPALIIQTGAYPGGIAAGDFNGDGKLDLVVTDYSGVSILPGNGDGTFGAPTNYAVTLGGALEGVALADFNGDGKADIAVTSIAGTFVLLGHGDGTFRGPAVVSRAYVASYIVTGDFDGDGHTDLVISGYDPADVDIFRGQGDGTFQWFVNLADGGAQPGPLAAVVFPGLKLPSLVIGNILSANASVVLNGTVTATGTIGNVILPAQAPPSHEVQCVYGGDGNYAGSTSNQVALIAEPAAVPVFSPAGGTYGSVQTVTITDATSGASIYYTVDGSTPTPASSAYTAPIKVSNGETLKIVAYASGYLPSPVATAVYTLQVATPMFSPSGGTYSTVQPVTISDATPGASIFYTTDGTTPTSNSTPYTGAIQVASSQTLQAIGIAAGFTDSAIASQAYTVFGFSIAATPTTLTVSPGQSANFTITVTPLGSFSNSVTFSCSGLPATSSCLFQPASVTPAGGPVSSNLTIYTTGVVASDLPLTRGNRHWPSGGILALAGLTGLFLQRRYWNRFLAVSCVLVMAALAIALGGCGGSGPSSSNHGTPQGLYTLMVAGTSSSGVEQTTKVTLDVQ
jgi:hypothetical protein